MAYTVTVSIKQYRICKCILLTVHTFEYVGYLLYNSRMPTPPSWCKYFKYIDN